MNVKMFGFRCLVEHYRPKSSSSQIILPDAAQQADTHRMGKVVSVGTDPKKTSVVKPGDIVMFQINSVMENTQKYVLDGRHYMNLHQGDIIGRLTGDEVTLPNFEMVGDYVLLKHFFRESGSPIILPEHVMRQSTPEFIYFKVLKKGSTVTKPVEEGDEVVANLGKLTPIFFVERLKDGTSNNQEFCYTHQDWLDGKVIKDSAEP